MLGMCGCDAASAVSAPSSQKMQKTILYFICIVEVTLPDLKRVEIEEHNKIKFTWRTDKYGRAEFVVCLIWKRGKVQEVFIYPKQQPDAKHFYHANLYGRHDFSIQSWTGLDNPYIWIFGRCKEHKCMSMSVYVPNGSQWFELSCGGIYFGRGE